MSPRRRAPARRPVVNEPPAPEPTLGDLLRGSGFEEADEPALPGFEMADDPLPEPVMKSYIDAVNERARTEDIFGKPIMKPEEKTGGETLEGEILGPSKPGGIPRYESRIRILDAWQYTGSAVTAPSYVDRNWIGYANHDPLRHIEPGPCLRVPISPDAADSMVVICRVGDYVVHEEIVGDDGRLSEKIEVWERDQFHKLFLPAPEPSSGARTGAKGVA